MSAALAATTCGADLPNEAATAGGAGARPDTYEFESRFQDGSSVSYPGQTLRHVLINDLTSYIEAYGDALIEARDLLRDAYGFENDAEQW